MWPDNDWVICYIPYRFDWLSFKLPSFILLFLELPYFIIFVPFIFPRENAQSFKFCTDSRLVFRTLKTLCWEEERVITRKTQIRFTSLKGCSVHCGAHPRPLSRADPPLGPPSISPSFFTSLQVNLLRGLPSQTSVHNSPSQSVLRRPNLRQKGSGLGQCLHSFFIPQRPVKV